MLAIGAPAAREFLPARRHRVLIEPRVEAIDHPVADPQLVLAARHEILIRQEGRAQAVGADGSRPRHVAPRRQKLQEEVFRVDRHRPHRPREAHLDLRTKRDHGVAVERRGLDHARRQAFGERGEAAQPSLMSDRFQILIEVTAALGSDAGRNAQVVDAVVLERGAREEGRAQAVARHRARGRDREPRLPQHQRGVVDRLGQDRQREAHANRGVERNAQRVVERLDCGDRRILLRAEGRAELLIPRKVTILIERMPRLVAHRGGHDHLVANVTLDQVWGEGKFPRIGRGVHRARNVRPQRQAAHVEARGGHGRRIDRNGKANRDRLVDRRRRLAVDRMDGDDERSLGLHLHAEVADEGLRIQRARILIERLAAAFVLEQARHGHRVTSEEAQVDRGIGDDRLILIGKRERQRHQRAGRVGQGDRVAPQARSERRS